jgi:uncharacterized protein YcnI
MGLVEMAELGRQRLHNDPPGRAAAFDGSGHFATPGEFASQVAGAIAQITPAAGPTAIFVRSDVAVPGAALPSGGARRLAAVLLIAGVLLALLAGAAQAHVTVNPATAVPGSFQELTFQAPNESADARFVKLVVHLPNAEPLASLNPRTLDGWTITTAKARLPKPITTDDGTATEYTSQITWTAAAGAGIPPEQYQDFVISAGPLPVKGTMVFTVDQFYSDGSVVHWDEVTPAGRPEPQHPAPVLTLSDPARSSSHGSADGLARGLGAAGLAVGVVGLGSGIVIARRRSGGTRA